MKLWINGNPTTSGELLAVNECPDVTDAVADLVAGRSRSVTLGGGAAPLVVLSADAPTEVVSSKVLNAMQAKLDALEATTPMLLTALEELMGAMGGEPPTEAIAIAWTQALTAIAHAKGAPCPDADEGDECVELAWGIYEGLGVPSSPVRGWYHVQKHDDIALYEDDVAAARDNFERVAYWNEYTEEIVKLPESWTEVHEGEEVWPWWLVASGPKTPGAVSEVARVEAEFDRNEAEAFLAQDLQIARGE